MNSNIFRTLTVLAASAFALTLATADILTTAAGETHDGRIYKVLEETVSLRVGEDRVHIAVSDFNASSQSIIQAWATEHPEKVNVYAKWDVQPAIRSSVMPSLPEQFHNPEFKGMVSVDLVLNAAGQVIYAKAKKSTHAELEGPAVEAAKTWVFTPAEVGGKAVKSKLRIPFKFIYTPPTPAPVEG